MILDLKQFVPQKVCLSCDGCCRFKEEKSIWRPKWMPEERPRVKDRISFEEIISQGIVDENNYIKAHPEQGMFRCHFHTKKDNTCSIYSSRPFECQLYPFILVKRDEVIIVSVHLSCPDIQNKIDRPEFEEYVDYLKSTLQRVEVLQFLRRNPALPNDAGYYGYELKELFVLNLSE